MWLLYTNKPKTGEWTNDSTRGNRAIQRSGTSSDDRWWWTFKHKADAEDLRDDLREENHGQSMRLYLRKVTRIPSGWE